MDTLADSESWHDSQKSIQETAVFRLHMMSAFSGIARNLYFRSSAFRACVNILLRIRHGNRLRGLSHLASYDEEFALGPVQREEALLLFALCRVTRPRTVVEFGFAAGHGSFNFLQAVPPYSQVYSFDIGAASAEIARKQFAKFSNFHFVGKSQADFCPSDIGNQAVDLAFFDASHELSLNQVTFSKLAPLLSHKAIIAIHDTGTWSRSRLVPPLLEHTKLHPDQWINPEEFAHAPGERAFVDWVSKQHPEFSVLHLHSLQTARHGLSLLQRKAVLSLEALQKTTAA